MDTEHLQQDRIDEDIESRGRQKAEHQIFQYLIYTISLEVTTYVPEHQDAFQFRAARD